jgi:hypothetical protein
VQARHPSGPQLTSTLCEKMDKEKSTDWVAQIKYSYSKTENATATFRKMMKISLLVLPFCFIIICVGYYILPEGSIALKILGWVFLVVVTCSSLIWCLADSVINDYPFGKYLPWIFVLFLPLGIAIYLYRSRGFKNGSITLIKVTAFVAVMFFLSVVCAVVTGRILNIPLKHVSYQAEQPTVAWRVTTLRYRG